MASQVSGNLGFATKIILSSNVPTVAWSDTFGNGSETAAGIAVDSLGRAYIAGSTASGFTLSSAQLGAVGSSPATGTQNAPAALDAGYVLALAPGGLTTSYITFLNAAPAPTVTTLNSIALDDIAQAYVTGAFTETVTGIYVARLNPPGAAGTAPVPGLANFGGEMFANPIEVDKGNGIAVLPAVAGVRTAYVAGLSNATSTLVASASAGALANNIPQNYLSWGTSAGALNTSVNPAKLPALAGVVGGPPGGGDAVFATLTFLDLTASSTNVIFTAAAGTAGTNQSQTITFTGAGGATLPCNGNLGVVPNSMVGSFFTNTNAGTVVGAGGSFTISTGAQTAPALGSPIMGSFQVTGATGCPFIEPITVAVTYSSTTSYTVTASYTPVGGTAVTGASGIALTASVGNTLAIPATATLTVNVAGGTNVVTSATSVAPTNWPTANCANPITVTSGSSASITAGTAATVGLTINTACIALAPPGTYSGSITIASPSTPPVAASISVPYTITISGGITATPLTPASLNFAGNTAPALDQSSTLTASSGGPFNYVATYTAANTSGLSVLPAASVTFLTLSSGTLGSGASTLLVIQVSPSGLANGSYAGTITINPTSGSTFTPYTINVAALVGNTLLITQPSTSPLSITLPTGLAAGTMIPGSQLPSSQIVVTNASAGSITINNPVGVTSSFTGLATSPLALTGACAVGTNVACPPFAMSANTTGVPAGTYPGTITLTTSSTPTLSVSLPVNLTVTSQATFILTTSATVGAPLLTALNLTASSNSGLLCTGNDEQPPMPGISAAGSIPNVTYTTSVSSGVNPFTVIGGPVTVSTTPQPITVCANPAALGNTSGIFSGAVTVASASGPTVSFPVNLLLNSIPGNIDLSNAGVFRNTSGLGTFVLDLNQSTYNYSAGTTLTEFYGLAGDQPVAGDWLGTGVVSLGVFRQGSWYFDLNNDGQFEANEGPFLFGLPGDLAIVGDWTGSGSTKVGVFRCPVSGICSWYLDAAVLNASALTPGANLYNPNTTLVYSFGLPGDQPVASTWSGTNVDQIGIFRCPAIGAPASAPGSSTTWAMETTAARIRYIPLACQATLPWWATGTITISGSGSASSAAGLGFWMSTGRMFTRPTIFRLLSACPAISR